MKPAASQSGSAVVYLVAIVASLVTGALFAFAARVSGVEHNGILVAVTIIGAGVQMLVLIGWYLHFTRAKPGVATQGALEAEGYRDR